MCTRLGRLGAVLAAMAAAPAVPAAPPRPGFPLAPCQLAPPAASELRVAARCGTFEVPEVRPAPGQPAAPGGRTIALRVAVVESDAPRAAPDPVFVLAGGPGQAATEAYPMLARAFGRLARKRDVVLVDQRGTGGSGKLDCPEPDEPAGAGQPSAEERLDLVRACAVSLSRKADLAAYGTTAFVHDLDAVRAALGYEKVNLVGFSYGTRAALVYLREFPDRVRTLVLDGVAPMQMAVGASFEEDGQAAIESLLRRCAGEAACRARFPDLEKELDRLLAKLSAAPLTVATRDPLTGEPRTRTFGPDQLRQVLLNFAYTAETTALLPPLLHAAAEGDPGPLAGALQIVVGDLEAGIARPMQLSVLCAEDVPYFDPPPPGRRWFATRVRDQFVRLCGAWPVKPAGAAFRERVRSAVPALLLSGQADPVTPPRWAEMLLADLPRARHVVLPGQGHGVFFRGCLPRVAAAFVEAGSADGLDLACLERARAAPPFLDFQGSAP